MVKPNCILSSSVIIALLATEGLAQAIINDQDDTISALLNREGVPFDKCAINKRLYSALDHPQHRFEFTTGAAGGTVRFSEYRDWKLGWTVSGEFACSNGAVVCGIVLPTKGAEDISVGYEEFETPAGEHYVVFSHLRQIAFRREFYGLGEQGLKVELQSGFQPTDQELLIPYNVYRYSNCQK
ncbi:hypothetical protein [Mesorhizobium sp. KR9-304]|uniref:hypothetical protein n=1 Tax=Mesorhizobium sp. KR9-304 TaxID=3156614 RepID=UPI0032B552CC